LIKVTQFALPTILLPNPARESFLHDYLETVVVCNRKALTAELVDEQDCGTFHDEVSAGSERRLPVHRRDVKSWETRPTALPEAVVFWLACAKAAACAPPLAERCVCGGDGNDCSVLCTAALFRALMREPWPKSSLLADRGSCRGDNEAAVRTADARSVRRGERRDELVFPPPLDCDWEAKLGCAGRACPTCDASSCSSRACNSSVVNPYHILFKWSLSFVQPHGSTSRSNGASARCSTHQSTSSGSASSVP